MEINECVFIMKLPYALICWKLYSHFGIMQLWNRYDDDGMSVIVRVGCELAECNVEYLLATCEVV